MALLLLMLAFCLLLTGAFVAFSENPINSIIFLISTFVNTALILFFFGVDFLSLIFIIVYVGAIAVLFLFVIMMIAIKTPENNFFNLKILTLVIEKIVFYFVIFAILTSFFEMIFSKENYFCGESLFYKSNYLLDNLNGISILGQTLYNYFGLCFLIAGLILLVALIGSVLLTHAFTSIKSTENSEIQLSKNNNSLRVFNSLFSWNTFWSVIFVLTYLIVYVVQKLIRFFIIFNVLELL